MYEGEERYIQGLVGKSEGKRTPGKPSRRWEDKVEMGLQEIIDGNGLDGCGLGYGQVASYCECGNERSFSI
jgi:hypothetical protein